MAARAIGKRGGSSAPRPLGRRGPDRRDVEVGQRVRVLRLERKLSQTALGNRLGLTFQQIQKYEKGTNRIGAGRLQQIAEIFEIPVAALFPPSQASREPKEGVFELIDSAAALRLLRAFRRVGSRKASEALISLAEQLAGGEGTGS